MKAQDLIIPNLYALCANFPKSHYVFSQCVKYVKLNLLLSNLSSSKR